MTSTKEHRCSSRCVSMHPTFLEELQASHALLEGGECPEHEESFFFQQQQQQQVDVREDAAASNNDHNNNNDQETSSCTKQIPGRLSSHTNNATRHVSFTSLEIREYAVVPGDHPECSGGCPVALGWNYQDAGEHSVDQYEADRRRRRSRDQLRLCAQQRESLLSAHDCPVGEVRRAARRHFRSKSSSCEGRYGHAKKMQCFFSASHRNDDDDSVV